MSAKEIAGTPDAVAPQPESAAAGHASTPAEGSPARVVRVVLPQHLRTLARVRDEVQLPVGGVLTQRSLLDALEEHYPMLAGTVRDHNTRQRRAFLRFFACGEDLSHEDPDSPLPNAVAEGTEPFLIIGAIAGG